MMIEHIIDRVGKEDMCVAGANIRVWNMWAEPVPIYPRESRNKGKKVDRYAFKPFYEEFPLTMRIRLSGNGATLNLDTVLVQHN